MRVRIKRTAGEQESERLGGVDLAPGEGGQLSGVRPLSKNLAMPGEQVAEVLTLESSRTSGTV